MNAIAPAVLDALHAIEVSLEHQDCRAQVGPRTIEAESVRDLRPRMVGAMYEVLHAGRTQEKNLGRIVREPDVEEVLAAALPHATSPRRARLLQRAGEVATIDLGDVRVRIESEVVPDDAEIGQIVQLDLPAARPALSHGFYMIDGPHGMRQGPGAMRRVYLHAATPEEAATIWRPALATLNEAGISYRSKTLSHRDGYPRRDAIVFYLPIEHAALAHDIAAAVDSVQGLREDVSVFAQQLAPGVAMADEPADRRPQYRELSFGEHRCTVAASALLRSAMEPGLDLGDAFTQECELAGVDPAQPAFNVPPPASTVAA